MNEKELLSDLDNISISPSAKDKIRKLIERNENTKERKGEREELAKMIAVELKEIIPDSKQWLEVLKQLKIPEIETPKVPEVKIPEIKIPDIIIPEIKIPKIEVPEIPEIKVPEIKMPEIKIPKIEMPSVNIPKEMEVRGIKQFFEKTIKSINDIVKNKFSVVIHGGIENHGTIERDNPLPVIPVDQDGKVIKGGGISLGGRGGASVVGIKNKDDVQIDPATEDTLSTLNGKVITHDEHIKTLGFHESIGHLSTNTDIVVERAMGRKTGIGTGAYTLLEEAAFVQPSGDTQMYIESASADDDDGGSGANIITIEYFSLAWGQKKTVTVTMNGTTQVALSVADIYRIHKMYINKGGNAAGLIKLTNQAENVLYGQISQYHAFMQRCIFYVAEGERVTCTEAMLSSYSKEGVIGRVFASEEDASGNVVPRARVICEIVTTALPCPFVISESVRNPNNKRIAIGLAVTGVSADQNATGTIKGFSKPE